MGSSIAARIRLFARFVIKRDLRTGIPAADIRSTPHGARIAPDGWPVPGVDNRRQGNSTKENDDATRP